MKEFFLRLWSLFTKTSSDFFAQLKPVLESEVGKLWEKLVPMAVPVVTALMTSKLTGTEKQTAAVDSLKSAATSAGIQAATDILNSSVEIAYQIAKSSVSASK
jgi:hypothetical protein